MRSAIGFVCGILATVWSTFATLAVLPFSPSGKLGAGVIRWWGRMVLGGCFIKLRVRGSEHLRGGPFVITPNHASMLDIPTASASLRTPFHFVSRPFFFKVPFLGWGMFFARQISLDPKKPKAAAQVLESLHTRLDKGISVLLYPEGTRSPDGKVQRYKRGPFATAVQNGVPILPVYLGGTSDLLPKKSLWPRPGVIEVTIGEPIPTAGLAPDGAEDLRALAAVTKKLAQQVEDWTKAQEADWQSRNPNKPA